MIWEITLQYVNNSFTFIASRIRGPFAKYAKLRLFPPPCSKQSATRVSLVDLAGWWPLTWPNHPFSLSKNSCVPPQWNIILMLQNENDCLCQIYNQHSYDFIYLCVWLLTDSKLSSKISLFKKKTGVCQKSTPNRPNNGRDILLGDWLQRRPLVSDPGMHHGTCVTHVPWCISRSLTRGDGENVSGISGACTTRNFAYLLRGPCSPIFNLVLANIARM